MQDVLPMENIVFRRSEKEDIPYINSLFIEMRFFTEKCVKEQLRFGEEQ